MARICQQLGKISEALENYDLAIEICKSDSNWNKRKTVDDPSIEDMIETLENEKSKLGKLPKESYGKSLL
jgi:hypothetical protein